MKILQGILTLIHTLAAAVGVIALQALLVIIFIHVVLRFGFNSGINWSEEISSYVLLPAMVFLGMVMGVEEDIHINVNVLPKRTPNWFISITDFLKDVSYIVVGALICYYSYDLIMMNFEFGSIMSASGINNGWQYMSLPVAGGFLLIVAILALFKVRFKNNLIAKICGIDVSKIDNVALEE